MMVNMDVAIDYMIQLQQKGVTYSMAGSRTGADGTADCSGAVYAALVKGEESLMITLSQRKPSMSGYC